MGVGREALYTSLVDGLLNLVRETRSIKLHINEVSCIYLYVSVEKKFFIGTKRGTIMVVISGVSGN